MGDATVWFCYACTHSLTSLYFVSEEARPQPADAGAGVGGVPYPTPQQLASAVVVVVVTGQAHRQ